MRAGLIGACVQCFKSHVEKERESAILLNADSTVLREKPQDYVMLSFSNDISLYKLGYS